MPKKFSNKILRKLLIWLHFTEEILKGKFRFSYNVIPSTGRVTGGLYMPKNWQTCSTQCTKPTWLCKGIYQISRRWFRIYRSQWRDRYWKILSIWREGKRCSSDCFKSMENHRRYPVKKSALKNSQISQKNLCWSLVLIKLQALGPATLIKRDSNTGVFLWSLRNCEEHLFWRTSVNDCF